MHHQQDSSIYTSNPSSRDGTSGSTLRTGDQACHVVDEDFSRCELGPFYFYDVIGGDNGIT